MIGHILRHESLSKKKIDRDVEENIARGKPKAEYVKQIMQRIRIREITKI